MSKEEAEFVRQQSPLCLITLSRALASDLAHKGMTATAELIIELARRYAETQGLR